MKTITTFEFLTALENELNGVKTRSAWSKGVKAYAFDFLDCLDEYASYGDWTMATVTEYNEHLRSDVINAEAFKRLLLNGANDWRVYSYGGGAIISDFEIARRLCTPSEFKKRHKGDYAPSRGENWLDVQARALYQAYILIAQCAACAIVTIQ